MHPHISTELLAAASLYISLFKCLNSNSSRK